MPDALQKEDAKKASPAESSQLAALCKAAADPLRLDILRVLSNDSFGVQELAAIFDMPQPGMSHHLKVLAKVGLVLSRRQGNSIFYRRALLKNDADFADFLSTLFATIERLPLSDDYRAGMQAVYRDRSEQSRLYFERNADKFEENQEMLCELSQYLPNVREILDLMELPKRSRVLEVGPGQGLLLKELMKRYDHLVALDSSEEMLAFTRNNNAFHGRVQFINESLESFEAKDHPFDAVVLNMVLHHIPSPQQAFLRIQKLLRPGGYLLIADLCSHNQEWTHSRCGDVWLGFDPQDLKDWAQSAGLSEEQSLFLGLKNGFQIQLKLFKA